LITELSLRNDPEAAEVVQSFSRRMHNHPDPESASRFLPLDVQAADKNGGHPIADATMDYQTGESNEDFFPEFVKSDASGHGRINVQVPIAERVHITVRAPGYAPGSATISGQEILSGKTRSLHLDLMGSIKIGGMVVGPDSAPTPNAVVRILLNEGTPAEFKVQIAAYLSTLKSGYPRTLTELAAKAADPASGYPSPIKRDALKKTDETALALTDPLYLAAKNEGLAMIKATILALFKKDQLDAIVYPTWPKPAPLISEPYDNIGLNISATSIANNTGFPDLIVPAGLTKDGLPVTISFFGTAYTEAKLLGYGYDFEQATKAYTLSKYTPKLPSDQF